jgi:hypothetical protein
MDISKAINILADSVYDLKEKGRYNSIQRRNHIVDFYGYEFLDGDVQVLNQR